MDKFIKVSDNTINLDFIAKIWIEEVGNPRKSKPEWWVFLQDKDMKTHNIIEGIENGDKAFEVYSRLSSLLKTVEIEKITE